MSDQMRSEAESAFLLGDLLARQGDVESARGAFQSAIAMDDPEWSPRAAYHLGELLWATRDPGGAEAALRVATDAGHPEWTPAAQVVQGVICAARQDPAGAMEAYGAAIASGHPTHATRAWFNLGTLHQQRGETAQAVAAYRRGDRGRPSRAECQGGREPRLRPVQPGRHGRGGRGRLPDRHRLRRRRAGQLARQNLAAMRQLTAERQRGQRFDIVEDARDVSVGRGKGGRKWRRWVRRDDT